MILDLKQAECGYGNKAIIGPVSFSMTEGDIVCLLGPNGVGKTTLFKTILGFLPPVSGEVLLNNKPRSSYSRKQFAQLVSFVPQLAQTPFDYTIFDVVLTGCMSHLGIFQTPGHADYERAQEMIEELGIAHLAEKKFNEASGGERQMSLIARALMQDADLIIMDEPTAALDFGNQVQVLNCIKRMAAQNSKGIFMTTHNPDHAFLVCTRAILALPQREIIAGDVSDVMTEENLAKAYRIPVRITEAQANDNSSIKTCVPLLQ